ncbi:MAG: haloacid dehalogenase type II [Idiomarina sp.]|nr:haloacid dehalogenase type II [Idiomarina sp.]
MQCTLAFDVYGTLFDTQGVVKALAAYVPKAGTRNSQVSAADVARLWRDKQLEYAFRRGLMQRFKDFSVCTRDALRYCNVYYELDLSAAEETELLAAFDLLPLFSDVSNALSILGRKHRVYAFSNGCQSNVESLLENAGVANAFNGVISVTDTKSFKPDPSVYTHFLRQTHSDPEQTWLVSANAFDIIGADSVGMRTAWVKRQHNAVFDPWGVQPEVTVEHLGQLNDLIHC